MEEDGRRKRNVMPLIRRYQIARWPTPVILATQEAEIRWITDQNQPREIFRRPYLKNKKKKKKPHRKG
jgi:hypothetical protein